MIRFGDLEEDDIARLKMGRFSDADERMMADLVRGSAGERALKRLLGVGVDTGRLPYSSSRPRVRLPGGRTGTCFAFSQRWVTKRHVRPLAKDRVYFSAPASEAIKAGARREKGVRRPDGGRGAWSIKGRLPAGAVRLSVTPAARGLREGAAVRFCVYVHREEAAVFATARLGDGVVGDGGDVISAAAELWRTIEQHERAGGRVQARITAELPWEPEVGDAGRARIVERFCGWFADEGLPHVAVVHAPEPRNDARNFHAHILWHDRAVEGWREGRPALAATKHPMVRDMGFPAMLRARWAECVNAEMAAAGLARRFDPRSYDEAGIAAVPGVHLGSKAFGLERQGVATERGAAAAAAAAVTMLAAKGRRIVADAQRDAQLVGRLRRGVESAAGAVGALAPEVRGQWAGPISGVATDAAAAIARLAEAHAAFRDAKARRVVGLWRARALPGRLDLARGHPDGAVRAVAEAVVPRIREAARRRLGETIAAERLARRRRDLAVHEVADLMPRLEAERRVLAVAAARAGLERAEADLASRDTPEASAARERREREAASREAAARDRVRAAVAVAFGDGPNARLVFEMLVDRRQRRRLMRELAVAKGGEIVLPAAQALREAEADVARAGRARRRRVAVQVWSPGEAEALGNAVQVARAGLAAAVAAAEGVPLARALLQERGLAGPGRGRAGAQI